MTVPLSQPDRDIRSRRHWRQIGGYLAVFLVVALMVMLLLQFQARDERSRLVIEKLDRNNEQLLCVAELQKQESIAINNLLVATFASSPDAPGTDLQAALNSVVEITERFEKAQHLCDTDPLNSPLFDPGDDPDGTTTTTLEG